MKKRMTLFCAMLMAVMMIISMMPVLALAADGPTVTMNTAAITDKSCANPEEEDDTKKTATILTDTLVVGDVFYVPVMLSSDMAEFNSFNLAFEYTEGVLEFIGTIDYCSYVEGRTTYTFAPSAIAQEYNSTNWCYESVGLKEDNVNNKLVTWANGAAVANDGILPIIYAGFKVVGQSATGTETIGVKSSVSGAAGVAMTGVNLSDSDITYVSGTVSVEKAAAALTFANGSESFDFDTLKADDYTLTSPGENHYFAGWFSGLTADEEGMITVDADGRYILTDTATGDEESFNAVELRPKYDEAPESGTYNALWIHDDGTSNLSTMVLEVYGDSFKYRKVNYTDTTNEYLYNNDLLRAAWSGSAGNGRVKLVKDLDVYGPAYHGSQGDSRIQVPLKLDLNGCTLRGVEGNTYNIVYYTVLDLCSGTEGNALESSRGQGRVEQTYFGKETWNAGVAVQTNGGGLTVIRDVDIVAEGSTGRGVTGLDISESKLEKMENVNITVSGGYEYNTVALKSSNSAYNGTQLGSMDNCTITTTGKIIESSNATGNFKSITNCTMTTTDTSNTPIAIGGNQFTFGAGNRITAMNNSALFDGEGILAFTSADSTYKCAEGGNVLGEYVMVTQTPVANTIAYNDNGTLTFKEGFTLLFYSYDGSEVISVDRYLTGETPKVWRLTYTPVGIHEYNHLGWTTTMGSSELVDPAKLTADSTLYAVRETITHEAVVAVTIDGNLIEYPSWDSALKAVNAEYWATVTVKLLKDTSGSGCFPTDYHELGLTLDLNGHTFTYTGSSYALFEPGNNITSINITSSAEKKGTIVLADGAKGLVFLNRSTESAKPKPVTISNVRIEAPYLAANSAYNAAGAVITVFHPFTYQTESLTMTNVEIEATNCPAVEFSVGSTAAECLITADFTNVKLSGNTVAVATKGNGAVGASHVRLTVDAASSFKGAAGTYPIQESNGNFGLTPFYPQCKKLEAGTDGWYGFVNNHSLTKTEAKDATCNIAGNNAYWTCSVCGKFFSDAEGKNEIQKDSWVLAAGHDWDENVQYKWEVKGGVAVCRATRVCKADQSHNVTVTAEGDQVEKVTEVASTCTTNGSYHYEASFTEAWANNPMNSDTYNDLPLAGHSLTATEAKDATCTTAGNSAYWTCSVCGKFFSDAEGENEIAENSWVISATGEHTYVDGVCSGCGAKDPDQKFNLLTNMTLGNDLAINFFVNASDWEAGYYAVITKDYADGRETTKTTGDWTYVEAWGGQYYYVVFDGVAAKEMGDQFTVVVYDAEDNAVSNEKIDSIKAYAMRTISNTGSELDTLLVDMLNYGAAAQVAFSYNTENPVNNQLTEAQQEYATKDVECNDIRVKGVGYAAATLTLESRIELNFIFYKANITQDMYAVVTYTNHYGDEKEVTILGSEFKSYNAYGIDGWYIPVDTLVVADAKQEVTMKIYDANNNVVSECIDSIESYVARSEDDLYNAITKFATSAYAYLH